MKRFIYVVVVGLIINSCNSNNDDVYIDNTELLGKWNWTSTSGSILGIIIATPVSLGKAIQIIYHKDYTFSIKENSQEILSGNYNLEIGKNNREVKISYTDNYKKIEGLVLKGTYYFHSNNKLIISDGYADGYQSIFEKE